MRREQIKRGSGCCFIVTIATAIIAWFERGVGWLSGAVCEDASRALTRLAASYDNIPILGSYHFQVVTAWMSGLAFVGAIIGLVAFWWIGRKTGALCIEFDGEQHKAKTQRGILFRVCVRNDTSVDLDKVRVIIEDIHARRNGRKERQKNVNGVIGCYLTPSNVDAGDPRVMVPELFALKKRGGKQLVDVIHMWDEGQFYLYITSGSRKRGRWHRDDEANIDRGSYLITLKVISETRFFGRASFYFNMTDTDRMVFESR